MECRNWDEDCPDIDKPTVKERQLWFSGQQNEKSPQLPNKGC